MHIHGKIPLNMPFLTHSNLSISTERQRSVICELKLENNNMCILNEYESTRHFRAHWRGSEAKK